MSEVEARRRIGGATAGFGFVVLTCLGDEGGRIGCFATTGSTRLVASLFGTCALTIRFLTERFAGFGRVSILRALPAGLRFSVAPDFIRVRFVPLGPG
jgi:hypothetical protein